MEKLTKTGCSLLLVSHSSQQILQFCERAIWIENGQTVLDGKALTVIKAYEEFTQKLSVEAKEQAEKLQNEKEKLQTNKSIIHDEELRATA